MGTALVELATLGSAVGLATTALLKSAEGGDRPKKLYHDQPSRKYGNGSGRTCDPWVCSRTLYNIVIIIKTSIPMIKTYSRTTITTNTHLILSLRTSFLETILSSPSLSCDILYGNTSELSQDKSGALPYTCLCFCKP